MRRKDILFLMLLLGVISYSWNQLRSPLVETGSVTVDASVLASLSKWSGLSQLAQAEEPSGAGRVKGVSTDDRNEEPKSLLPVETYDGSPLIYDLESMLEQLGVTTYPEDVIEVFPLPELGIGSTIRVYRAAPVEVTDWGKKKSYRTWQQTVQGFLDEQAIELGDKDRIEPSAKQALSLGDDQRVHLLITRVAITEVKQEEKIEFKVKETEDPELPRGQKKVTKGELGKRQKVFQVTRENGVEVKRVLLKNEVIKEAKDELVVIGTKVIIGKTHSGRASWYKYNSTKVATDLFKRGTELRITNLDNGRVIFVKNDGCICADTGYVVDLHPDHFTALGGKLTDGVMKRIKLDEVLN